MALADSTDEPRAATRGSTPAVVEVFVVLSADDPRHAVVAARQLDALSVLVTQTEQETS